MKGFNTRSWGFPKGKINKDELEIDCAAREVYEETGFDIRSVELSLDDYIVVIVREQQIKLYIVPFVGEDTYFEPKTRKEIEVIKCPRICFLKCGSRNNDWSSINEFER